MQSVLSVHRSWHDPLPGLRRAAALLVAVAALETAAILLNHVKPWLSPIYILSLTRALDILFLLIWGSYPFSKKYIQAGLKESIFLAALLGFTGVISLIFLKGLFGISLFEGVRREAIFLLTSCFLAPVAEELVFRGILYRLARERWPAWVCTIPVSILFAALHWTFHQSSLLPFCGSVIFCLIYEKTKSILSPILVHITGNLIIYVLPLLPLWQNMSSM
jgi:hypothetical protein